jgi:hypothetical protein
VLELSIPEQHNRRTPETETRPAETERWLAQLPVLNVTDNMRKIYSALSSLNRTALKPQVRFRLLELYRNPVSLINAQLQSRQITCAIPLSEKNKEMAEQLRNIQLELAYGYKAVVTGINDEAKTAEDHKQLAIPVHRAIRHLTGLALRCYEAYAPVPEGTWKEIHQLYLYAKTTGIDREPAHDASNKAVPLNDIEHVFKQAILVGLSNPYQLPFRMCSKIDNYLDKWAPLTKLADGRKPSNKKCQFIVCLTEDRPGIPCEGNACDNPVGAFLALDTKALVRQIHTQLTTLSNKLELEPEGLGDKFFDDQAKDMLHRLVITWGINPTRRFSRVGKQEKCELAVSVDAINYFLNGEQHLELSAETADIEITVPSGSSFTYRLPHAEKQLSKHPGEVVDEGASGYRVLIEDGQDCKLRVGDVVAVKSVVQTSGWTVGLIRWIQAEGSHKIEIGIQKLAPCASAVAVQPVEVNQQQTKDFSLAIMLPAIPALQQPSTLITHKGLFRPERNLFVETGTELRMVRAKRVIEETPSFEWFEYSILNI